MTQMEKLENTIDNHAIGSVMHLMDSITRCGSKVQSINGPDKRVPPPQSQ